MTITLPPAPVPAGREVRPVSRPLVAVGSVLLALGVVGATTAAGVLTAFGPEEALDSGFQQLSTPTAALVTDVATLGDVQDLGALTGDPVLEVSVAAEGATSVFVGVGPADDVSGYLEDVAVDEVTDLEFDPFRLDVRPRDGAASPAPPPGQDFWSAAAVTSGPAGFAWPIVDGDHRLVVMNADGSPGVSALVRYQVRVPDVFSRSLGLLLGSGMVGVVGVGLIAIALRRSDGRRP